MKWKVLSVVALAASLGVLALAGRAWLEARRATPWERVMLGRAKEVEAKVAVTELAWGVAQCAERSGALPPTSKKVPAELRAIRGVMYQSALSNWGDPAFACAGFHMHRPQSFQYQWVRAPGDLGGTVQANADFDGDGEVDHIVQLAVRCGADAGPLRCRPDPMPTEPFAPLRGPAWWD